MLSNLTIFSLIASSTTMSPLFVGTSLHMGRFQTLNFIHSTTKFTFSKLFYQTANLYLYRSTFENSLNSIVHYNKVANYENREFTGEVDNPFIVVDNNDELNVIECTFISCKSAGQLIKYNKHDLGEKNSRIIGNLFSKCKTGASMIEFVCPITLIDSNCVFEVDSESTILHLNDDIDKYCTIVNFTSVVDSATRSNVMNQNSFNVTTHNFNITHCKSKAHAIRYGYKGYANIYLSTIIDCDGIDALFSLISSVPRDRKPVDQSFPEVNTLMFYNNSGMSTYTTLSGPILHIHNCVFSKLGLKDQSTVSNPWGAGAADKVYVYNCWFDIAKPVQFNFNYDNCGWSKDKLTITQLLFLNTSVCNFDVEGGDSIEFNNEVGLPDDYAGLAEGRTAKSKGTKLSGGAIAGITIGCVAVAGIAGFCIYKFVCVGASIAAF